MYHDLFNVIRGQTGSNGRIRVKSAELVEMYSIYVCFDSELSQEFRFNIFQGQLGSLVVKLGSMPSKRGQIGLVGQNMSNMDMFRVRIFSRIQI